VSEGDERAGGAVRAGRAGPGEFCVGAVRSKVWEGGAEKSKAIQLKLCEYCSESAKFIPLVRLLDAKKEISSEAKGAVSIRSSLIVTYKVKTFHVLPSFISSGIKTL
jgi:hypothetical protein